MADTTLQLIKTLPPELREKILKEYIKIKIKERKDLGWRRVNKLIFYAPFCETNQQIVKSLYCPKCKECDRNDLCNLCKRNGIDHYLNFPLYWEPNSSFQDINNFLDWYKGRLVEKSFYCSKCEESDKKDLCNMCEKNVLESYYNFIVIYFEESYYRSWYNSWREGEELFWNDVIAASVCVTKKLF